MILFKAFKPYKSMHPELDCYYKEFASKTMNMEQIFDKIAMELCTKNKKDLILTESKLKDSINEIEMINLISIAISLFIAIIGILLDNIELSAGIIIGMISIVYVYEGILISHSTRHYRYYKLCLQIISYIRKDEIKVENKLVKCIAAVENTSK